jgi:hypothetical protein
LLRRNIVAGNTLAFRAKYNKAILPFPNDLPWMIHDGWIAIVLSMTTVSVFIDEPLVKWRQHTGQQTGLDPRRDAGHIFNLNGINLVKSNRIRLMEELIHKNETVELIKHYITRRIDVADYVIEILNAEIVRRRGYAGHFRLRKSLLSDKHITRLWRVIKELLSGRYHRCSNGIRTAVGDLIALKELPRKKRA